MTTLIALEKKARDGRAVRIEVSHTASGAVSIASYVDGHHHMSAVKVFPFSPRELRKMPAGVTHGAAGIALTAQEARQVEEAMAKVARMPREVLPELPVDLRAERRALVIEIVSLLDEGEARAEKYHATGAGDGYEHTIRADYEKKAQSVRQMLAAFDAEHPEIIAAIRAEQEAERRERVERHMWD